MATIRAAGDAAFVVDLGDRIDPEINRRVRAAAAIVAIRLAGYPRVEVVPAYAAFMVSFDPTLLPAEVVEAAIHEAEGAPRDEGGRRRFTIPVRYGGELGPDLDDVAEHLGISAEEIVARHTDRDYPIYCLGFSPGFPFLGGLDASLSVPRLETPRPRVPAGSVAIGGSQTGVYPTETPGGWRLIGRTPHRLFDVTQTPPVPYEPGDLIRFAAISLDEYSELQAERSLSSGVPIET